MRNREFVLCNRAGQTFNRDGQFCYDSSKMVVFPGKDRDNVKKGRGEYWDCLERVLYQRESEQ
mgnify:CR=1 FL=1